MTPEQEKRLIQEGRDAHKRMMSWPVRNHYPSNSEEARLWQMGFDAAKDRK